MNEYYNYRDSGIKWIGNIPEHWELKRFRFIFSFSRGLSITKQNLRDTGIPCFNYNEIHSKFEFGIDPSKNHLKCVNEEYLNTSKKSLLCKGNFVFADTSEDIEGSGNFTFLDSKVPIFAGYHTIIVRQKKEHNYRFLAYFFDSIEFRNQIRSEVAGIKVFSITQAILKNSNLILPTSKEQTAIAKYLDRKTIKIDELISKKERLLALYEEEKTAIIDQAVTKGIDPNVKMKDSGVEWLGEIPEHWGLKEIKYILEKGKIGIQIGPFGSSLKSQFIKKKGFKVYGQENIINNDFSIGHRYVDLSKFNELIKYEVVQGDILITMMGTTGKCKIVPQNIEKGLIDSHLIRLRLDNSKVSDKFFMYLISDSYAVYNNIKFNSKGSIMDGLNTSIIKSLLITAPPISEQKKIVDFLSSKILIMNEKIVKTEKVIELLKEYKTALISEVVTGKIKVTEEN